MTDKNFLQILAARLSGGLSLSWEAPESRDRPIPEEEIIRGQAKAADMARHLHERKAA